MTASRRALPDSRWPKSNSTDHPCINSVILVDHIAAAGCTNGARLPNPSGGEHIFRSAGAIRSLNWGVAELMSNIVRAAALMASCMRVLIAEAVEITLA